MSEWIRVENRLPKKAGQYLCFIIGDSLQGNKLDGPVICYWYPESHEWGNFFEVTHWMPLPEPPK